MSEIGDKKVAATGRAKAAKPRKPVVSRAAAGAIADAAAIQTIAAGEAAVEQLTPSPAQLAETIEAVTSPAIQSDPIAPASDSVAPAPVVEELTAMATVTSPSDAANEAGTQAQAAFGDFSNRFKTAFEKSSKLGEEMVDFAKGNVEAVIASSKVAAKAGESLGQEAAEYGKKHFEAATAAFKSFATVKSPTELFQLQSEYAKSAFDSLVAEASRVSESLMKVAGDVAQPISTRYAIAAEKIKSTAL